MPNQGHIVSLTVHDVHHSKEPQGMMTSSHLYSVKQVSCLIILGCMNAFCYCRDIIMPLFVELQVESSGVAIKGMSLEGFLEKFAEDEENDKVAANFYPLSNDTLMFQWSEIPAEGQPLLVAIVRKHPHFMTGHKLGA